MLHLGIICSCFNLCFFMTLIPLKNWCGKTQLRNVVYRESQVPTQTRWHRVKQLQVFQTPKVLILTAVLFFLFTLSSPLKQVCLSIFFSVQCLSIFAFVLCHYQHSWRWERYFSSPCVNFHWYMRRCFNFSYTDLCNRVNQHPLERSISS